MTPTDGEPDPLRLVADCSRLAIFGEVDAATAPLLDAALAEAAEALEGDGGQTDLVVDCRGLRFIDSSGLNVFVANAHELGSRGGRLVLESPPASARRLFEIAGLDRVVTIRE